MKGLSGFSGCIFIIAVNFTCFSRNFHRVCHVIVNERCCEVLACLIVRKRVELVAGFGKAMRRESGGDGVIPALLEAEAVVARILYLLSRLTKVEGGESTGIVRRYGRDITELVDSTKRHGTERPSRGGCNLTGNRRGGVRPRTSALTAIYKANRIRTCFIRVI